MKQQVIAIDIGASSGRVVVGNFDGSRIELNELYRFANQLVKLDVYDCWDIDLLYEQVITGIQRVLDAGIHPKCIGIDTWGVDFVLLNKTGQRLGHAVSYRDNRTSGVMEQCFEKIISKRDIYHTTGVQFLSFNTLYQLLSIQREHFDDVETLLLIPDYLNYRLTGVKQCEYTNASTTQLLDCQTRQWSELLLDKINIPHSWFLPPQAPNRIIGEYQSVPVASVASHDTASAVIGTPLQSAQSAYLCSGTWSLMGYEALEPALNDVSLNANITNEGGAEGHYRTLKNIMGMWLIQNIQKQNPSYGFADLAQLAQQSNPFEFLIDPDSACFLHPSDMQQAIVDFCVRTGQGAPQTVAQIARCIYDSLALRYADVFRQLNQVAPCPLTSIHVVGGGANNDFLNQLCADVCQVPVNANPTEASALGNIVGQLIAMGAIKSVQHGREVIANSFELTTFLPKSIQHLDAIKARFETLTQ